METYDDAVMDLITRWHTEWGTRIDHKDGVTDATQIDYVIEQCERREKSGPQMLSEFARFAQVADTSHRLPRFNDFMRYLEARPSHNPVRSKPTSEDLCYLCGGTTYMPVVVPVTQRHSWTPDPASEAYVPGEPWPGGRRLVPHTVRCQCAGGAVSEWTHVAEMHRTWYADCYKRTWKLHPGERFGPIRATHRYLRRATMDDWEPAEAVKPMEGVPVGERLQRMLKNTKGLADTLRPGYSNEQHRQKVEQQAARMRAGLSEESAE